MIKDHVFRTVEELCEYYFDYLTKNIDKHDFDNYEDFHAHIIDIINFRAPFLDNELDLLSYTKYLWNEEQNDEVYDDYI